MYDPLCPINKAMKHNFSRNVDRYYCYFKSIVSEGRKLDMHTVEQVAQGRVWTGKQAKANGLVDELGGLHRAIAYTQQTYTSGDAAVEVWPKPKSMYERLMRAKQATDADSDETASIIGALWLALFQSGYYGITDQQRALLSSGMVLAMDENLALEYALHDARMLQRQLEPLLPADFWV
jgi:ClpP class serine protease